MSEILIAVIAVAVLATGAFFLFWVKPRAEQRHREQRRVREEKEAEEDFDRFVESEQGDGPGNVLQTATRVRQEGLGSIVRESFEQLVGWAEEDESELRKLAGRDGRLAILFSDIEDSTVINEQVGDRAWLRILLGARPRRPRPGRARERPRRQVAGRRLHGRLLRAGAGGALRGRDRARDRRRVPAPAQGRTSRSGSGSTSARRSPRTTTSSAATSPSPPGSRARPTAARSSSPPTSPRLPRRSTKSPTASRARSSSRASRARTRSSRSSGSSEQLGSRPWIAVSPPSSPSAPRSRSSSASSSSPRVAAMRTTAETPAKRRRPASSARSRRSRSPEAPRPDDLVSEDIEAGDGKAAAKGDKLTVQYVGVDCDTGEEFDASWGNPEPFEFTLGAGEVIPGWDEGLEGMKEGGRRQLDDPARPRLRTRGPAARDRPERDPRLRDRPREGRLELT